MDLSLLGMLSAAGSGSSSSKKASGNPVQLDRLQGGVPFNSVTVSGKNLLTYPYDFVSGQSYYGVVVTDNGDGGIRINGTAQDDHNSSFYIVPPEKLFFKGNAFLSGGQNDDVRLFFYDGNANIWDTGNGVAVAYGDGCSVGVWIRKGTSVDTIIYPQLELCDTATPYEPPITGRELTVGVSGKNLLDISQYSDRNTNGIDVKILGSSEIICNGTCTGTNPYPIVKYKKIKANVGDKLTATAKIKSGNFTSADGNRSLLMFIFLKDAELTSGFNPIVAPNRIISAGYSDSATFTVSSGMLADDGTLNLAVQCRFLSGDVADNLIIGWQLEYGDTATEYEPYHGAEYTITPDSNPYIVPVDITQYDGINVLSISDNSNPTISVSGNKASEQLGTIYRTLNNKPVLLFDGNIPTSSSAGYAEFTIDKEYSALIIVPICNESRVYEPGACTVIPIGYITEEEQGFTVYGYPKAVQRVSRSFIKRIGNTIYVRSQTNSCDRMIIYGI